MHPASDLRRHGALIAIGGKEDRTHELHVLRHALQACRTGGETAGPPPRVAVLTAASQEPGSLWRAYREAFGRLGAEAVWLDVRSRDDAHAAQAVDTLGHAQLLFMTGGDQGRLVRLLTGTPLHHALLLRQRDDGLCVAGTSAGASALGTLMPGAGSSDEAVSLLPASARIPAGLGLLPGVVIDQHFTQRQRLARLLHLVSQRSGGVGLGIDEDTAAIVRPGVSLQVVGSGSVTLVDGRRALRSQPDRRQLLLRHVALHRLEPGAELRPRAGGVPSPHRVPTDFSLLLP